jgi:hypothetical protein
MERVRRWSASLAIALLAAGVLFVGVAKGTFAASDTDPFGYVSEADLMARGSLSVPSRLAAEMPWPFSEWTFSPAGYRPRTTRTIVPTYPQGLPLVMALFQRAAGRTAVFYVVPLLGALAVWMTGRLGGVLSGSLTGALSAALIASSPIFLYQVVQPVSDVAATAWWTTALLLVVSGGPTSAFGAGLAASMAILTRPNLVPLAGVIAGYLAWLAVRGGRSRRHHTWRLLAFSGGVIPGGLALAGFNILIYGSPLTSGYGGLRELPEVFSWAYLLPNLDRYPRWLVQAHTPLIGLAVLAPLLASRPAREPETVRLRVEEAWFLLAFAFVVFVSYVFSPPWGRGEWGYVRYLLPAIPALIVLSVSASLDLANKATANRRLSAALVVAVAALVAGWQVRQAEKFGAFSLRIVERRYVDVGRYIDRLMPRDSAFITGIHSGSIWYYSGRSTLRYEWLGPGWLDEAVKTLAARGVHAYIVLEEAEEAPFREKFGARNLLGRLDWPPAVQRWEPIQVKIFDPVDRPRFFAGEPIVTGDMNLVRRPVVTALPGLIGGLSR